MKNSTLMLPVCIILAFGCASTTRMKAGENPFDNSDMFIMPSFVQHVTETAKNVSQNPVHQQIEKLKNVSTAYWIDCTTNMSDVQDILLNASTQQLNSKKNVTVLFVIHNLPDRGCLKGNDSSCLKCTSSTCYNGIHEYAFFIDKIVDIFKRFDNVKIAVIVEPFGVAALAVGPSVCRQFTINTAYRVGITYALQTIGPLPHVHVYLDISNRDTLPDNSMEEMLQSTVEIVTQLLSQTAGGQDTITGFSLNVAGYLPFDGPIDSTCPTRWNMVSRIEWLSSAFGKVGVTGKYFVVDTSRNGKLVCRMSCDDWCNVKTAGLGIRPTANTANALVHALVYAKVPGTSDGARDPMMKGYNRACESKDSESDKKTPRAGGWWNDLLIDLVKNANSTL